MSGCILQSFSGQQFRLEPLHAALGQAIPDLVSDQRLSDQRRIDLPHPTGFIERKNGPHALHYHHACFRFSCQFPDSHCLCHTRACQTPKNPQPPPSTAFPGSRKRSAGRYGGSVFRAAFSNLTCRGPISSAKIYPRSSRERSAASSPPQQPTTPGLP